MSRHTTHLALLIAVLAGALTACSPSLEGKGCEGSDGRVREVSSHGILGSHPTKAVVPAAFKDLESGCWEDSGEAWVYAERIYVYPGPKAEVISYYEDKAARDGWKQSRSGARPSAKEDPTDICFIGTGKADATVLRVSFITKEMLRDEGRDVSPEFAAGSGYRVAVTSTVDNVKTDCDS
ncbi:hypothetical protein [Streptomyces sp. NPDC127103]|uniref:hypothetical protein n=1 Tax=Streptomyces sp. NPDC127103 TaxID=3347139 RepID=UPI00364A187A